MWFFNMPDSVQEEIGEYALDLVFVGDPAEGVDAAHIFVSDGEELQTRLSCLRKQIAADGHVWVSWRTHGDMAEQDVRAAGEHAGFINTKACAVDELWSGLKLVIPKEAR